jgi:hypothetical protein
MRIMRDFCCSRFLAPGFLFLAAIASSAAAAPPRNLPLLMTESGRDYVEVEILKFDPEGPIFRHRDGLAKIRYQEIKEKTRTLLGYPMAAQPKAPVAQTSPVPTGTLIPVRITTRWAIFRPSPPRPLVCRRALHPWFHHQAAWPFQDPFRPFAAVDLMVTGGVVPHPGWAGPGWIW